MCVAITWPVLTFVLFDDAEALVTSQTTEPLRPPQPSLSLSRGKSLSRGNIITFMRCVRRRRSSRIPRCCRTLDSLMPFHLGCRRSPASSGAGDPTARFRLIRSAWTGVQYALNLYTCAPDSRQVSRLGTDGVVGRRVVAGHHSLPIHSASFDR